MKLLNGNRLRAITSGWKCCINFSLASSARSLLVGLVGAAASATAGPITDNINFTGEQLNPTFGQFSSYSGPQLFSGFTVVWSDRTLDFTAAANMPEVNGSDESQAPDFLHTSTAVDIGKECGLRECSGVEITFNEARFMAAVTRQVCEWAITPSIPCVHLV